MDAIGQLSGGIAHDFNNMLAVVIGGLDMARRRLTRETAEMERHIVNAMEGANRAASLPQRLLAFARPKPLQPEGVAHCPMRFSLAAKLSGPLRATIRIGERGGGQRSHGGARPTPNRQQGRR